MLSYAPIGRRVVVKRKPKDVGGFKLSPELEREGHPDIGTIIAVGQIGLKAWLRGVAVGKTIYYTRYSPVKIEEDGQEEDHYFVEVDSILGISNK